MYNLIDLSEEKSPWLYLLRNLWAQCVLTNVQLLTILMMIVDENYVGDIAREKWGQESWGEETSSMQRVEETDEIGRIWVT